MTQTPPFFLPFSPHFPGHLVSGYWQISHIIASIFCDHEVILVDILHSCNVLAGPAPLISHQPISQFKKKLIGEGGIYKKGRANLALGGHSSRDYGIPLRITQPLNIKLKIFAPNQKPFTYLQGLRSLRPGSLRHYCRSLTLSNFD